jgi:hypothetical protein
MRARSWVVASALWLVAVPGISTPAEAQILPHPPLDELSAEHASLLFEAALHAHLNLRSAGTVDSSELSIAPWIAGRQRVSEGPFPEGIRALSERWSVGTSPTEQSPPRLVFGAPRARNDGGVTVVIFVEFPSFSLAVREYVVARTPGGWTAFMKDEWERRGAVEDAGNTTDSVR